MNARGFVLIEWLIASALVIVIAGAVFAAVAPLRDAVERSSYAIERVAGARGALETIAADLREAGAGPVIGVRAAALASQLPSVVLLDALDGGEVAAGATAVRISRVPLFGAQARLAANAGPGDTLLRLDMTSRCSNGPPACGFRRGDTAVLLAPGVAEVAVVDTPLLDTVTLAGPLANAFQQGAVFAQLTVATYGLRDVNGVPSRLVRLTDGGAEQPLLDDVVAFELAADAAAPAQRRTVTIRLRVQAASAMWRGADPALFLRPGTASSSRRWLADLELRAVAGLRNPEAPW
jgi:type II secretory pathway pseudopilin PulG